jgi:hypothetical protein
MTHLDLFIAALQSIVISVLALNASIYFWRWLILPSNKARYGRYAMFLFSFALFSAALWQVVIMVADILGQHLPDHPLYFMSTTAARIPSMVAIIYVNWLIYRRKFVAKVVENDIPET